MSASLYLTSHRLHLGLCSFDEERKISGRLLRRENETADYIIVGVATSVHDTERPLQQCGVHCS